MNDLNNISADELITLLEAEGFVLRKIASKINCISIEDKALPQELKIAIKQQKTQLSKILQNKKIPLSLSQSSLWFINQLKKNPTAYNVPFVFKIQGILNIDYLEQSTLSLTAKHEILRTIFPEENGIPYQKILDIGLFTLELQQNITEHEIPTILAQEIARPFDLQHGPIFRVKIFKIDQENVFALFLFHHIIIDTWSANIFFKELSTTYNTLLQNNSPAQEMQSIQYADYTLWQNLWLQSDPYKSQLAEWQQYLETHVDTTLPTDTSRPKAQSFLGKSYHANFPKISKQQIQQLSQKAGCTTFMFLLACVSILLHRYSSQETVTIGVPCANRINTDVYNTLGFFTNALPIKIQFAEDFNFLQLLSEVKQNCMKLFDRQAVPFENIIKHLNAPRNIDKNPIFQILFDASDDAIDITPILNGVKLERLKLETDTSKFDLFFSFSFAKNILQLTIEYTTDLYSHETILRIATHFAKITEQITKNLKININQLSLLTTADEHLLAAWNNTKTHDLSKLRIHELFSVQAQKFPQSYAIVYRGRKITYADLDARSNSLAHRIENHSYKSYPIIGVFLEKGIDSITAILGILKAHATYMPLALDYPDARLSFMLQDANPAIILTTHNLTERLKNILQATASKILYLEDESRNELITGQNKADILPPAYIIYTSGSTGRPKGAVLPHQTIINLIQWQTSVADKMPKKIAQFANLNFDVSLQEIFFALLNGHELHLVPENCRKSMLQLMDFLIMNEISHLFLPTSVLNYFATEVSSADQFLPNLREIIVAGEALQITESIRIFFSRHAHLALTNHYGPAETHVVTSHKLPRNPNSWPNFPAIGKPITNAKIHILDKHLNHVPPGSYGEIFIEGAALAHGYLNQPGLTKSKFVDNLFSPGTKLYRTGDLARWRIDGNLEFLGRNDGQVKIRGYRIELKEIESLLNQHPQVKQSVATICKHDDKKFLVAYIAPIDKHAVVEKEIKSYLEERLPDYMLPNALVFIEQIPLTENGKVHKKALPIPNLTSITEKHTAPRNQLESHLAKNFCTILKINQIGIHDNFFALGGHSLTATQLSATINRDLKTDLNITAIFEHPSIAQLSAFIEKNQNFNFTSTKNFAFEDF